MSTFKRTGLGSMLAAAVVAAGCGSDGEPAAGTKVERAASTVEQPSRVMRSSRSVPKFEIRKSPFLANASPFGSVPMRSAESVGMGCPAPCAVCANGSAA